MSICIGCERCGIDHPAPISDHERNVAADRDAARAEAARLREVIEAARPVLEWVNATYLHLPVEYRRWTSGEYPQVIDNAREALAMLDRLERGE